jgi:hypothetical protein
MTKPKILDTGELPAAAESVVGAALAYRNVGRSYRASSTTKIAYNKLSANATTAVPFRA